MQAVARTIAVIMLASALLGVQAAQAKEVILTTGSAGRFLGSLAELQVLAASQGLKVADESKGTGNPFQNILKAIKSPKLKDDAAQLAKKHGFASVQEWADTGKSLGHAYLYVTAGSMRGTAKTAVDKHKDTAIRELEKTGLLSDKQKKRLQENLENASEELAKEPPKENIAVVNAIKPAIESAIKGLRVEPGGAASILR